MKSTKSYVIREKSITSEKSGLFFSYCNISAITLDYVIKQLTCEKINSIEYEKYEKCSY